MRPACFSHHLGAQLVALLINSGEATEKLSRNDLMVGLLSSLEYTECNQ